MTSVVDVCNYALAEVGENTITSLADGNTAASRCALLYPRCRDAVLRLHPWNCAIKRTSLASTTITPVYEFEYQYQLPSDLIRLLDVEHDDPWRVENRKIKSNLNTALNIRYVYRVEDPNEFDSHVIEVLTLYLALKLVEPLTQSNTKKQLLDQAFRDALVIARRADAQEDPPTERDADTWLLSRI